MKKLYTLIELLVTIGITVILLTLLLVVMDTGRQKLEETQCISNFKQLGYLSAEYIADNNGKVYTGYWINALKPYTKTAEEFAYMVNCPADEYDWEKGWEIRDQENSWFRNNYDMFNMPTISIGADMLFNMQGRVKAAMVTSPSSKVLLFDFNRHSSKPKDGVAQFNYFYNWFGREANKQYRDIGPDSFLPAKYVIDRNGNTDLNGDGGASGPRFRHQDNTKCGMLAIDGHSFTVDIHEVTPRMTVDPRWFQGVFYPNSDF